MDKAIQSARKARKEVEQVRKRLLAPTPEALDACGQPLAAAIFYMEALQVCLQRAGRKPTLADQHLRAEVDKLRLELRLIHALMEGAAQFHEGYGRLLRSEAQPGLDYSRFRPAPPPASDRLVIMHG